ncbi:MAG: hypothetical protein WD601_06455, partial [Pseudohongiellaceae bacterium]
PEAVHAVADFSGNTLTLPVRIEDTIYRFLLNLQSIPPEYVFTVDLFRIISLADVGQEVAELNRENGLLTIPSVRIGNTVVSDVVMELTDSAALEFTLQSFSQP